TGSFTPVTNANLIMVTVAMGTALPTGTPSVIYDPSPGANQTMFLLNTGGTVNGTSVSIWFYYLLNPTQITGSKTVQVTFGSTTTWNKSASPSQAVAAGAVAIKPVVPAAADDVRVAFDSNWGETTGNILANGTWGHWVMVFDGSQSTNATRLKFYFNNAAQTLTFTGTIPATTPNTAYTLRLAGTAAATDFID